MTTRGLKEADMPVIADLIDEVVKNINDEKVLDAVKVKVNGLMKGRALFNA